MGVSGFFVRGAEKLLPYKVANIAGCMVTHVFGPRMGIPPTNLKSEFKLDGIQPRGKGLVDGEEFS